MTIPVWMIGSGGRTPFVGHFRGARRTADAVDLAWAGRIAASASVSEGWDAAQSARDALARLPEERDATALLGACVSAVGTIDPRWLGRGDLSVLFVASANGRAMAVGAGLGGVWMRVQGAWRAALPADHPLLGEPGELHAAGWELPAGADAWIAVPTGLRFPSTNPVAACGVRP